MKREALPIDASLPRLVAELEQNNCLLLSAAPGSGKTTRAPAVLVDSMAGGRVIVLEPRRLAARAAAARVSWERGGKLGEEVGFQVRHQKCFGKATRLLFMTEGVLLRKILADPFLEGVAAVVLDEFHERHLEGDLALAMLREVQETVRPELRLLVMSATLETENLQSFLGDCPLLEVDCAAHPVEIVHLERPQKTELAETLRKQVDRALGESPGDLLVFLPGINEIRRAQSALADLARRSAVALLPLHGSLGPDEQDRVLRPGEQRKIVLATNLAESSLTIPGVSAVIDSGLARVLRHDPGRGLDQLRMEDISMASARQRAGRAGRSGPGICYRLWSKAEERARPAHSSPEIRRVDLTGAILQVHAFAGRPAREFKWFEAPELSALERGERLLEDLHALRDGKLSKTGKEMLRLPLHPRLARMMLEARHLGCSRAAACVAALVSERDMRAGGGVSSSVDLDELLGAVQEAMGGRSLRSIAAQYELRVSALEQVLRAQGQFDPGAGEDRRPDNLGKAILAAFPDRLFRLRSPGSQDGVMVGGRGLVLAAGSDWSGDLFIALLIRDSGGRGAGARVQLASPVDATWLHEVHPEAMQELQLVDWDDSRQKLLPRRELRFRDLVLTQSAGGRPEPETVAALLRARIADDPLSYLQSESDLRGFLDRVAWLGRRSGDLDLPEFGNSELADLIARLGSRVRSLKELRSLEVLPGLRASLDPRQLASLEQQAPERVTLPSGRRARVDYSGEEPSVPGKIQEFFGSERGPQLPGSGSSLVLHLLGPNQRPLQITRDLASFWRQIYPGLRLEMKRRYPRHSWPEDPTQAQPETGPRRRRPS